MSDLDTLKSETAAAVLKKIKELAQYDISTDDAKNLAEAYAWVASSAPRRTAPPASPGAGVASDGSSVLREPF